MSYTGADVLGEFSTAGAGTIHLNLTTLQDTLLGFSGGNGNANQSTVIGSMLNVTYAYRPDVNAPEPGSTVALLAIFGGSILAQHLRRRRNLKA